MGIGGVGPWIVYDPPLDQATARHCSRTSSVSYGVMTKNCTDSAAGYA
jgi:hypothetical protein